MNDRAIGMLIRQLASQGASVSHDAGRWFIEDPQMGRVEMEHSDASMLNRRAREIEARLQVVQMSAGQFALNSSGGWMAGPSNPTHRPGSFVGGADMGGLNQQTHEEATHFPGYLNRRAQDEAAIAAMGGGTPHNDSRPSVMSDANRQALEDAGVLPPRPGTGSGNRYNTSQVASQLGWSQAQVRAEAERRGLHREGRTWSFGEEDLATLQGGGGAAGGGGSSSVRTWLQNMMGRAGAPVGPQGHTQLAGAALGGLAGLGAQAWNVGTETVRSVGSFVEGLLAAALGAAGGASGAAISRIAGGIGNFFAQAFTVGGHLLGSAATALGEVLMGGLRLVGTVAAVGIAAALGAVLIGAVVGVGSALGEAFGRMIGAASQAAQDALSGVVTVLKDLSDTGKKFAETGIGLQGMGGVKPGQDAALQMMGQATGTNLAGMFNSWQMRPEFASARFGAVGAQFNPNDINSSILNLVEAIRALPELLRVPMANAATGGNAAAIMPLLYQTHEQLQRAATMPQQLGYSPQMTTEIYQSLNNNLSSLSALFTGLKLDVLTTALPSIDRGVNGLWGLWQAHRQEIMGAVGRIPAQLDRLWTSAEKGWTKLEGWWAGDGKTLWGEIKDIARDTYQWFTGVFWPELSGFLSRAFHMDFSGAAAQPGHVYTDAEKQANFARGEHAGQAARDDFRSAENAASWVANNWKWAVPAAATAAVLGHAAIPYAAARAGARAGTPEVPPTLGGDAPASGGSWWSRLWRDQSGGPASSEIGPSSAAEAAAARRAAYNELVPRASGPATAAGEAAVRGGEYGADILGRLSGPFLEMVGTVGRVLGPLGGALLGWTTGGAGTSTADRWRGIGAGLIGGPWGAVAVAAGQTLHAGYDAVHDTMAANRSRPGADAAERQAMALQPWLASGARQGLGTAEMNTVRRGYMPGSGFGGSTFGVPGGAIEATGLRGTDGSHIADIFAQKIVDAFTQAGKQQARHNTLDIRVDASRRYAVEVEEQGALESLHNVMIRAAG